MTTDTLAGSRTTTTGPGLGAEMAEIGRRAREAATAFALASPEAKVAALNNAATAIRTRAGEILTANARDRGEAETQGMSAALRDRLALDPKRVEAIAALPDPVGHVLAEW